MDNSDVIFSAITVLFFIYVALAARRSRGVSSRIAQPGKISTQATE